jgi:Tfp pilus assembly protein PilN
MKKFRLSKVAWLILSAGIFVVVLAGLGFTYSGQNKEQNNLNEQLEVAKTRLEKTQDTGIQQQQIQQLEERLVDSQARLDEAKKKLLQAILSVDVTEKLFQIAESNGVLITSIGTSNVQPAKLSGMTCSKITINCLVEGEPLKLIDFIIAVNQNYVTGYVTSAQISLSEEEDLSGSTSIQVEVYSSKGIEDAK